MKTILRKVPDEDMYYNFEDEVEVDETKIIICGNHNFRSFGDPTLIKVVNEDYYDDEVGYEYEKFEMLKKLTSKDWEVRTMRGYSQSDWNIIYYVKDETNEYELDEIENFYMGKVSEFTVEEENDPDSVYHVYVPDDIVWEGKDSICRYLDLQPETTTIYEDDGYERVYKYKEIN